MAEKTKSGVSAEEVVDQTDAAAKASSETAEKADSFEIEIYDEEDTEKEKKVTSKVVKSEQAEKEIQLPMNFVTYGEIENDDARVYIHQKTLKQLEEFSASDTSRELGSILVGQYAVKNHKSHIVISDFIEAKYTDASASTLTFTHESWDYIHKEHAKNYKDTSILGWQHTHPGYGIFLSNYDLFIQENFFNLPFQIAYVIDPCRKLRGFFQWKDGEVKKLKGFYVYDEVGETVKVDFKAEKKQKEADTAKVNTSKLPTYISVALAALILVLGVVVLGMRSKVIEQQTKQASLESALNSQGEELNSLKNAAAPMTEAPQTEATTQAQTEASADYLHFMRYVVKAGDSLSSICKENHIDYSANINLIKAINGIQNENIIRVGQTLILPVEDAAS